MHTDQGSAVIRVHPCASGVDSSFSFLSVVTEAARELDRAVLAAYGWSDLGEALFQAEDALGLKLGRTAPGQELLRRLLVLNLERARLQAGGHHAGAR